MKPSDVLRLKVRVPAASDPFVQTIPCFWIGAEPACDTKGGLTKPKSATPTANNFHFSFRIRPLIARSAFRFWMRFPGSSLDLDVRLVQVAQGLGRDRILIDPHLGH